MIYQIFILTFMSDRLKEIDLRILIDSYKEAVVEKYIIKRRSPKKKIKFDDKILHKSRLIKHFTDEIDQKKFKKIFKIYKKIKKTENIFSQQRFSFNQSL